VRDCLSVDIADFDTAGIVYGRPGRELTPAEIARETWEQMKAHVNDTGRAVLRDEQVASWDLDRGLVQRRRQGGLRNLDPLFISTPGSWARRPGATTAVPNLFLAADYVRAGVDTASMEGANDAGRQAANAILAAGDSPARPADVHPLYQPPEWEPFRRADEEAWRAGLPNALDGPALP
jgi:uncharacterized protein with NAD-binding domain and iron-sulfur cluster